MDLLVLNYTDLISFLEHPQIVLQKKLRAKFPWVSAIKGTKGVLVYKCLKNTSSLPETISRNLSLAKS